MRVKKIQSFTDLSVGDYVVHENHGLGIYCGIEKLEVDKKVKDYIKIEYQGGSNLYILATQLDMIQKICRKGCQKTKAQQAWRSGMDQDEEPCQRCGKADCRRPGEAVCPA